MKEYIFWCDCEHKRSGVSHRQTMSIFARDEKEANEKVYVNDRYYVKKAILSRVIG